MSNVIRQVFSFRGLVVAILLLIWLEVGGGARLAGWYRTAGHEVSSLGKPSEEPAPATPGQRAGGLGDLFQAEVEAGARDRVLRGNPSASAPSK